MEAPREIWGNAAPPVSPAVACTMNLATQFFLVYLGVALVKTTQELGGNSPFLTKMGGLLTLAKFTVNFAPMLANDTTYRRISCKKLDILRRIFTI